MNISLFHPKITLQCHKCCHIFIRPRCYTRWHPWLGTGPSNSVNNPEGEPHTYTRSCNSAGSLGRFFSSGSVSLQAPSCHRQDTSWYLKYQNPTSNFPCSFTWKQTTLNYKLLFSRARSSIFRSFRVRMPSKTAYCFDIIEWSWCMPP